MNLNKEQVELAVKSGLELLGPDSTVAIPAKLNDGVFLLKQMLVGILKGEIGLGGTTAQEDASPEVASAVSKALGKRAKES